MSLVDLRIPRLSWTDYALSGTASCLAAFSAGWGLNVPEVAYFLTLITALGSLASWIIQRLVPRSMAWMDGYLYALLGAFSMFFAEPLNNLLPGEGFPLQLRIAGVMCWMLVFGSLCMWRDATLLFQAVPGIAVFGLVGTWDTFAMAPFLFFGFLLCYATLFARAHGRTMMLRADESGFHSNALDADRPGGFLRSLLAGPWRWMAGPEWALGSALAVVLVSLIGAPILKLTTQPIAGFVKIPLPPTQAMRQAQRSLQSGATSNNFGSQNVSTVGNGPHGPIPKTPIFKVQFPNEPYLRYRTYSNYNTNSVGRIGGWLIVNDVVSDASLQSQREFTLNARSAQKYGTVPFSLLYIDGHYESIPVPGDIDRLVDPSAYSTRVDGTIVNTGGVFGNMSVIKGIVRVPILPAVMSTSPDELPGVFSNQDSSTPIPQDVRDLAVEVTQGMGNPYDKAEAIRKAISRRCTYDIDAPATPTGKDPVENFLFDSKRGYCDLFASSMVLMARSVNLPARYVTGYGNFAIPGVDQNGYRTITAADYHAWAEVYFQNVGWLVFDATEGAAEAPGSGRGASNVDKPWYLQPGFLLAGVVIFATAVIIIAYFLFRSLAKSVKLTNTGRHKIELERMYIELVSLLESRTGKPRRPSQTPFEYLDSVQPLLNGTFEPVKKATYSFVSTFYGLADPSPGDVSKVKTDILAAKEALKQLKRHDKRKV